MCCVICNLNRPAECKLFFSANYLVKHDPKLEQFRLGSKKLKVFKIGIFQTFMDVTPCEHCSRKHPFT